MVNDAYLALLHRDELKDTLFFAGLDNQCKKEIIKGKKCYVFENHKFCLTIAGKSITIDGVKVKSVREAKRIITERCI